MHVDGSPATCVNLALYSLVPDVDLVISGPNVGHNVGRCAHFVYTHSATLCQLTSGHPTATLFVSTVLLFMPATHNIQHRNTSWLQSCGALYLSLQLESRTTSVFVGCSACVTRRASVLSSGTLGAAMEASLAHKKAIAISFPFNGWGSWTEEDIQTAVQVRHACIDAVCV